MRISVSFYFSGLSDVAGGMQVLENRGGCSGQKHSATLVTLQSATSRAVPPLTSLEQVVQNELEAAPAGVISNAPLRRIAPTLASINILFFTCGSLFQPGSKPGRMGYYMPTQPFLTIVPLNGQKQLSTGATWQFAVVLFPLLSTAVQVVQRKPATA